MLPEKNIIVSAVIVAAACLCADLPGAHAYWVWTPETKKFINPKYAVKDSPKEQFDWAMGFFEAKDYQRAALEFEKLTKQYEYSTYASRSQYYVGLSYEMMGKFYMAFLGYQKTIDNYPRIENLEEIIEKELAMADIYMTRPNPKIMGADIMTSSDRAVEIYRKVVDNAPFGKFSDVAQYKLGEALKKMESYEEAIEAFQKLAENYPESQYLDKARFEIADCANRASLKPAYASEPTERAIKIFEEFTETAGDEKLTKEAGATMIRLKDKAAEKSFSTAEFYEKQRHYDSAVIYYKDVVDKYPESSYAVKAKNKIMLLSGRKTAPKKALIVVKKGAPKEKPAHKVKAKAVAKKSWLPGFGFGKKSVPKEVISAKAVPVPEKAPAVPAAETAVKEEAAPAAVEEAAVEGTAVEGTAVKGAAGEAGLEEIEADAVNTAEPVINNKASNLIAVNSFFKKSKGWVPFKFTKALSAPKEITVTDSNPDYVGQDIKN